MLIVVEIVVVNDAVVVGLLVVAFEVLSDMLVFPVSILGGK